MVVDIENKLTATNQAMLLAIVRQCKNVLEKTKKQSNKQGDMTSMVDM